MSPFHTASNPLLYQQANHAHAKDRRPTTEGDPWQLIIKAIIKAIVKAIIRKSNHPKKQSSEKVIIKAIVRTRGASFVSCPWWFEKNCSKRIHDRHNRLCTYGDPRIAKAISAL
jgi:hypothetical protein